MKKAIVIGASSGIGKSVAEELLRDEYVVGVTGRREDLLKTIQEKHSGKAFFKKMDVQDLASIESICNELVNQIGGLDLLIISSGIGEENSELKFEIEDDVIKTNVQGFTCIAGWGINFFKEQGHGHLVNISSIAGIRGNGQAPSYNATKAFQINYLEGLRLNVHRSKLPIYITDVRPGFVDTAMAKGEGLFWVASVQKVAKQILKAIKGKKKVIYVTKRWRLIALLLRIIPFSVLKRT